VVLDGEDVTARPTSYRIARGMAIVPEEQNANMALAVADRGYVLQTGRIVLADRAARCAPTRT